jgi:hypothetical protein
MGLAKRYQFRSHIMHLFLVFISKIGFKIMTNN